MAGAGYKLFTTGQVLTAAEVNTYLQEQTVMVFNDAASRTTALSGVLAEGMVSYLKSTKVVEIYTGAAWVSLDDPNAIQNTIVDAKGDLIAATGNDVPARLAVGNNGETLVADSSASTGLRWQGNFAAGKNKIINGAFDIWQRGTSATANNAYVADRFFTTFDGSGTFTTSQQSFTAGTAPVAGYEGTFFQRIALNTTGTTTFYQTATRVEDVRTLANQVFTFSFWAKANTATTITGYIEQYFGTGGSATTGPASTTYAVTTSWQRFSYTTTMPSISGKTIGAGNYIQFTLRSFSIAAGATLDIWGVQLEAGNTATAFQTATGTLAGELAACQRYYYKSPEMSVVPGAATSSGLVRGGTNASGNRWIGAFSLPVTMRTSPTCVVYNPNNGTASQMRNEDANTNVTVSGIFGQYTNTVTQIDFSPTTSANNVVVGYITASAEL